MNWENEFDQGTSAELLGDSSPSRFQYHSEVILIPANVVPQAGIYRYGVQLWSEGGSRPDYWEVDVIFDGTLVVSESGVGDSELFAVELDGGDSVTVVEESCVPSPSNCCTDLDCRRSSSCANTDCVIDGNLRITLTWIGGERNCLLRSVVAKR